MKKNFLKILFITLLAILVGEIVFKSDGMVYANGEKGTKDNPYVISNINDFNLVRDDLEGYYILEADINLEECEGRWEPIGSEEAPFAGHFNGNGHKIYNLKEFIVKEDVNRGYYGVFGYVQNCEIINLGIEMQTDYEMVLDKAWKYNGEFGLLVAKGTGVIKQCYAMGNVIGRAVDDAKWHGTAVSTNIGSVGNAGLLCGFFDGTIEECYTKGNINIASSYNSIDTYVGGIVGIATGEIRNCYSISNVTNNAFCLFSNNTAMSGGIVSGVSGSTNKIKIENCYHVGVLEEINRVQGSLTEEVTLLKEGVVRNNENSTVEMVNCYYLSQGLSPIPYAGNALSEQEMLSEKTYTNWDFDNVWTVSMNINGGYPSLKNCIETPSGITFKYTGGVAQKMKWVWEEYNDGTYFSVNCERCGHAQKETCNNCRLGSIVEKKEKTSIYTAAGNYRPDTWTCMGFARYTFFEIFGYNVLYADNKFVLSTDLSEAQFGDYIYCYSGMDTTTPDHTAIFLKKEGNKMWFYESNYEEANKVGFEKEHNITEWACYEIHHASNYEEINNSIVDDGNTDEEDEIIPEESKNIPKLVDDFYQIETCEQLIWFAELVNGQAVDASGNTLERQGNVNAILLNDIDASTIPVWKCIGTEDYPFTGIFDGNNHKVYNLRDFMSQCSASEPIEEGFFGALASGAEVKNLGILIKKGHMVEEQWLYAGSGYPVTRVGLLAGDVIDSTITNCYAKGDINYPNTLSHGLLVGRTGNTNLMNCYAEGSMVVNFTRDAENTFEQLNVGGIVGASGGTDIIKNVYSKVNIRVKNNVKTICVGGISGNQWGGTIENAYFIGDITGNATKKSGITNVVTTPIVTNCFYGDNIESYTDLGMAKQTSELKKKDTFTGWDFAQIWGVDANINDGYPFLRSVEGIASYILEDYYVDDTCINRVNHQLSAEYGTSWEQLMEKLPSTVYAKVCDSNNKQYVIPISLSWEKNNYNGMLASTYYIEGKPELTIENGYIEDVVRKIVVCVAVDEPIKLYDVDAAVQYARSKYNVTAEKCAGFVSMCLQAGGLQYYCATADMESLEEHGFVKYENLEVTGGDVYVTGQNFGKIAVGDVIQYYCGTHEAHWRHVAIVTSITSDGKVLMTDANGQCSQVQKTDYNVANYCDDKGESGHRYYEAEHRENYDLRIHCYHYGKESSPAINNTYRGWTNIENYISDSSNDSVTIAMNDSRYIPESIFESAKNCDKEIIFDYGKYKWTIKGALITAPSTITFEVKEELGNIPLEVIQNKGISFSASRELNLTHTGDMGMEATLSYCVDKHYIGKEVTLFYYNPLSGELVEQGKSKVDSQGYVEFKFTHASDYILLFGENSRNNEDDIVDDENLPLKDNNEIQFEQGSNEVNSQNNHESDEETGIKNGENSENNEDDIVDSGNLPLEDNDEIKLEKGSNEINLQNNHKSNEETGIKNEENSEEKRVVIEENNEKAEEDKKQMHNNINENRKDGGFVFGIAITVIVCAILVIIGIKMLRRNEQYKK